MRPAAPRPGLVAVLYRHCSPGARRCRKTRYLRAIRDEYLLTNSVGRKFVEAYYSMSPPVADYIRGNETLRSVVRTGLKPLVELSRQLVKSSTLAAQK